MQYGFLLSVPRTVCCATGMILWVETSFLVFLLEEYCQYSNPVFCDGVSIHRLAHYYYFDKMAQTRIKESYFCFRLVSDFCHLELVCHFGRSDTKKEISS